MNAPPLVRLTRACTTPTRMLVLLTLVSLPLAAGCGRNATSTTRPFGGSGAGSFFANGQEHSDAPAALSERMLRRGLSFPLAVGNRWDYDLHARIVTIPDLGAPTVAELDGDWQSEIVSKATIDTRDYFLQAEYDPRTALVPGPQFALRQDRSGLYNLDLVTLSTASRDQPVSGSAQKLLGATILSLDRALESSPERAAFQAAARRVAERLVRMEQGGRGAFYAANGPESGEITMLRYPLHVGSRWVVRESPLFARVVVGLDDLMLPVGHVSAWRLRGLSELYGPRDEVQFWYGRAGLVRIHVNSEVDAVDNTGALIGKAIGEFDQVLSALTLAGHGGPRVTADPEAGASER